MFVATENSSYCVHEFSHAAVSLKSLCRIKMYHIVISRVNNVSEFEKESTVSFFQGRVDYKPLCVKVFFCQAISKFTPCLYFGDKDHLDTVAIE